MSCHGSEEHSTNAHASRKDHTNHHQMMADDFRRRFWISLVITFPILALSPTIQGWVGYQIPSIAGLNILLFLLASVVALWAGKPFYTHALAEIKRKRLGMMVLVSLAVLTGYFYSVATTFLINAPDFYWEISTLTVILLFGHWMEMKSVVGASGALKELVKLIPPKANLIKDGKTLEVETAQLKVDDVVLVKPGEQIPIDGVVVDGSGNVNEAMITGEAKPVTKNVGMKVIGGTLNVDSSLKVRVAKIGKDTALSQIITLVQNAQNSRPHTQRLADLAAHYLTIIAIVAGVATLIIWYGVIGAPFLFALTLTITVVVITCPHALGLAIPMVTSVTTTLAAKNGILIKDMDGLETARKVQYVLFDKTGTLTEGSFKVTDVKTFGDMSTQDILRIAASMDQHSQHMIAKSIVVAANTANLPLSDPTDFFYEVGKGVRARIDGKLYMAGNRSLVERDETNVPPVNSTGTLVYVASDERIEGVITLSDTIKENSKHAVEQLKRMGIKVAMLTGDNEAVAKSVADELELDSYFANVLPEQKINTVKQLQEEGSTVMMVGDGVNDAPALTQANVGVAIGAGTDVAVASSEIVLVKNNPLDIVKLLRLSHATRKKMVENLIWATAYNVIAIPLAAGALVPIGIILRPEWGAIAMTLSSVIVVVNALTLKKLSFHSFT
jgi:P-type Cu2+ transporter